MRAALSDALVRADADALNLACSCRTLDAERLRRQLEREPALAGLAEEIAHARPHLFSRTAVFINEAQRARMTTIVRAVEQAAARPSFRDAALVRAPAIARVDFGPRGVFLGYDFHLSAPGPELIEINTNAGGALLNVALARAQRACCDEMAPAFAAGDELARAEDAFFDMFAAEWRLQRDGAPLGRIAIVDDVPAAQYLYPEFLQFARLFGEHGVEAVIADARDLEWRGGHLQYRGQAIDLVYNRLTDFYFEEPAHAALRAAYVAGAVVVTPHPRAHALYADKRNLVALSDPAAPLAGVPRTVEVTAENAAALWAQRRSLFFKPALGYGSKAAYRGDKLTRRAWDQVLAGRYVAQTVVPASARVVQIDGAEAELKLDVRAYVYAGEIQLLAARLYQGQTTNFRTAGGGFAPVFVLGQSAQRRTSIPR
ncbi:MAG TPA: hypothetical protein VKP89_16430 [Burkholderiales bacterium]|nr:hypothetical protein [Burkholderiales bacterium]